MVNKMITFLLNNEKISVDLPPGMLLLDFIRSNKGLTGTKESCKEGDCGACLVLLGEAFESDVRYSPVNSCLLPLGEVHEKHVVTIEGINTDSLNPLQEAFTEEEAIQCGYCTPGFVVSLTAYFLNSETFNEEEAVSYIDGNICRCTGYVSIIRAVEKVCKELESSFEKKGSSKCTIQRIRLLVGIEMLPEYFLNIPERLQQLSVNKKVKIKKISKESVLVGGGTDLYVQNPDYLINKNLTFLSNNKELRKIWIDKEKCYIGAMTTVEDIKNSATIKEMFPDIDKFFKLIASTPIRHRATLGGNIINASPIGDLTIFFLALNASIVLSNGIKKRELLLKNFFKDYKQLDKKEGEILVHISFEIPNKNSCFNFEKVSKRRNLDIASVNSAIQLQCVDGIIKSVNLSAGGVAPIPLYLSKTSEYLKGKEISGTLIKEASKIAQAEISPIDDVRGSKEYKRLLTRQIIYSHFMTLCPEKIDMEVLL